LNLNPNRRALTGAIASADALAFATVTGQAEDIGHGSEIPKFTDKDMFKVHRSVASRLAETVRDWMRTEIGKRFQDAFPGTPIPDDDELMMWGMTQGFRVESVKNAENPENIRYLLSQNGKPLTGMEVETAAK
jgi:hypothetical protein